MRTWQDTSTKLLRTGATFAPWIVDAKATAQRTLRQLRRRPFELDFLALERLLASGDLCLDVGANRGQSIDALRLLSHKVRIVSLEPQEALFQKLVKRFQGDDNLRLVHAGAGEQPGETELFVPYYKGYLFDGLASLDETEAREWLRGRIFRFDESRLEIRRTRCTVVRLDDVIGEERVAFMKIDIQGTELDALRGAVGLLERDRPHLLVESPSEEIDRFLSRFGYRPHAFVGGRLVENERGSLNTFFLAH